MAFDDLKHAQRERLIYLDRCLTWRGIANRKDLMRRFDISTAQAALDFRVYLARARRTPPTYDPVRKTYIAASDHKALAPSSLTEAFDILVDEDELLMSSILPRPDRKAEPKIIAILHQAIRAGEALSINYTSMSSGADDGQWIAPTHFTSDGESVHLRAYSFKHGEYRNYLPIRIEPSSPFERQSLVEPLPEDSDWKTRAIIWLRPKSELSPEQSNVVMREFGFDGPLLRVEIRKALEFFFDRRWGLNEKGTRLERAKTEYTAIEEI
ncbi:hypothetical protein Q669_21560 [Labrenzia sp. C1B10]|uniref:WYL domain-containing protein n=1 Tax=unclassified Labrenzia TaxID=2648686 RepID=UPI0003B8A3C8|nr:MULTISPECIES: hypothetical protein [unclassified Labrenzia]ERP97796.1 hypothetical protein Q669_21560 [Labrenzia sp. C1B10]ERS01588.1 hypothetical protein Q675_05675 [Labrenzia sp. C1B70]